MKLKRVDIKNFRSIKDIEIVFDPTCRVLIGINESGKSNILDALAFLSDDFQPVRKNDLREAADEDEKVKESYIRFVFKLEKSESDQVIDSVCSKILAKQRNPDIVSFKDETLKVKKFCNHGTRNEGLYRIEIMPKEGKTFRYWTLGNSYALLPGWKKPKDTCPPDLTVELDGQHHELARYDLVHAADFPDIPDEYLEDAEIDSLSSLHGQAVLEITEEHLPKALFWEYDEKNFLPESVEAVEFSQNPDLCIPLKNMFLLSGIDNIEEDLGRALEGTSNQIKTI